MIKKTEVVNEINYFNHSFIHSLIHFILHLEVTFESRHGWKRQKLKTVAKGNQTLVAMEKCLARTPDTRVKILENVYKILSEYRTMYGIEMWGPHRGWKGIDKIHSRFHKIVLGVPRFAANKQHV
jgi:hypothetical protein